MSKFYCSLTNKIMNMPVTTIDNYIFEYDAITEWFKNNNTNPITKKEIDKKLTLSPIFNDINMFLDENQDMVDKQYQLMLDYKKIITNNYTNYNLIINIDIKEFNSNKLEKLFNLTKPFIHKKIIDKMDDLEFKWDNSLKLIHYISIYSNLEVIKHLVDKNVNINVNTSNYIQPIHYICQYQYYDTIKYFINLNVNLEAETRNKWKPIHILCKYKTLKEIKLLANKNINLNVATINNFYPIHLSSLYQNYETLYFLVKEKKVNINVQNNEGYTPLHMVTTRYKNVIRSILLFTRNGADINIKNNNNQSYKDLFNIRSIDNY